MIVLHQSLKETGPIQVRGSYVQELNDLTVRLEIVPHVGTIQLRVGRQVVVNCIQMKDYYQVSIVLWLSSGILDSGSSPLTVTMVDHEDNWRGPARNLWRISPNKAAATFYVPLGIYSFIFR